MTGCGRQTAADQRRKPGPSKWSGLLSGRASERSPGRSPERSAGRGSAAALCRLALAVALAVPPASAVSPASPASPASPVQAADLPQRIVSINLCTDQLLMMLVDPNRIAAVSHLSRDAANSVMAREAATLPVTHAQAEEVYVLEPDLVLASTYTSPATVSILRRLGTRVVQFAPAASFSDIRAQLRQMGDLVGARDRADQLIARFDAKLTRLKREQHGRAPLAAFYYANAYTSGDGTIAGEALEAAGMRNLGAELGLTQTSKLPLETLVVSNPDLVIKGRTFEPPALAQEILHHPAVAFLQSRSEEVRIADKYTVCGTPLVLEAVEQLAHVRRRLQRREAAQLEGGQLDGSRR